VARGPATAAKKTFLRLSGKRRRYCAGKPAIAAVSFDRLVGEHQKLFAVASNVARVEGEPIAASGA
jgi:hypothetical protein